MTPGRNDYMPASGAQVEDEHPLAQGGLEAEWSQNSRDVSERQHSSGKESGPPVSSIELSVA